MGKKKTEFSPVSIEEMDFQEEPSIPEVKRFQIRAPITPDKPNLPKQHPIYADRRENQLGNGNWFPPERFSPAFPQETQFHGLEACSDPSNSRGGNFENLAWKSQGGAGISSDLSMDSFRSLIALADAAATSTRSAANGTRQGNSNPYITIFNTPFEGDQTDSNFTASPLAKQDFSFAPNLWNKSSCAPDTYLYGNPHPSRRTYDLNSPPSTFTDEFSSQNISTPYAPITPDQSKKVENKLAHNALPSSMDEEAHQEKNRQVNEDATPRVEVNHDKVQRQLTIDSSSTAVLTELQENHNPDKGSNTGIDLNITPQQKPRRKKHRPKVVVEGKPKRTPPKLPGGPKESTSGKRKYVRRNRLDNSPDTPTAEVTGGRTDPKTAPQPTEKSVRRSLNFDVESSQLREESSTCRPEANENAESQAQNFCTRLGQGMEENVEKTQVGVAYRLTRSVSKMLEDYLSLPTAAKTDPPLEKMNDDAQKESARGKCQIIFSNETHDKQAITMQMQLPINTDLPSAPRSPNNSNCSSSSPCLTEEERARGLKRGHWCTTNAAENIRTNMIGGHYSSLHEFTAMFPANACNNHGIPGMLFPAIYKKKRTEKGHCTPTSSTLPTAGPNSRFAAAQFNLSSISSKNTLSIDAKGNNTSSISTKSTSCIDAQGKQQGFECKLALDQKGRMTKKRSKGPTRVRDFASLIGIIGCNQFPTFPAQGAPITGDMQTYTTSHNPYTCMEALVADSHATTTKKRTKRNSFPTGTYNHSESFCMLIVIAAAIDEFPLPDATQKRLPTMDTMVEYLRGLDINRESIPVTYQEQGQLVPYNFRYEEQRALVPYNFRYAEKDALVLYRRDGTVVPFEGTFNPVRKRKPRPKVDLDDETNKVWKLLLESINSEGIDGTDEEKAKWWEEERRVFRGRADSFIARMHLVQGDRRFSPWKGSVVDSVIGVFLTQNVSDHLSSSAFMSLAARFPPKSESNDSPYFEETSTCVNEPEVCILDLEDTNKWLDEKSNQPACQGSSLAFHDKDCSMEKKITYHTELLGSSSGDTSGKDQGIYKKCVEIFMGDKIETDDLFSSQNSAGSSQSSPDSSVAQTTEIIGPSLQDNSEGDLEMRSNPKSLVGSSFLELLQRETLRGLDAHKTGNSSSCKENGYTSMEGTKFHAQNLNKEILDNPNTSIKSIISSSIDHLQMVSDAGALETETLGTLTEESPFSSVRNEENCVSEQSGATAESVNQATVQNNMSASFQEAQKSPSEDNHACSSLEEEFYKAFPFHNRSVGNPKDNIQSQAQEKNHRMHQALEVQNLSRDTLDITDSTSIVNNPKSTEHNAVESRLKDHGYLPGKAITGISSDPSRVKRGRIGKQKQNSVEWDSLRLQAQAKGKKDRTPNTMDSLDYEAVRCADVNEIAYTIRERGMNNMLAERMKDFLNRLVREHGSIDLEWLRDVPPDKAKEYLLSFRGLGLKSVECVRLLTLHHLAFPVDTNVGRIAVRLGWVPLQPLPESLQLHLLELYPVLESIQRYLWPRLCKLDQRTLYELHYQMITFGKACTVYNNYEVFCTKSKPNCNACPMRGECRHFASAFASARLALPGPEEKSIVAASEGIGANQHPVDGIKPLQLPLLQANEQLQAQSQINHYEPIVEVPTTPEPTVEMPASPEPEPQDIEDLFCEDPEEIPTIKLNIEELTQNLQNYMEQNMELQEGEMSKALIALTPEAASLPVPKLKNVSRLRTEHRVYELPDSHPLLEGLDKREPDDPCSYLLAIWTPGETPNSIQPPERSCSSQEFGDLCSEETCFSCSSIREANSQTVRGTLLIPCRTAMRGSFPLNGTYFQVNEVFADHESSINPIDVPRAWLWNLPRRTVFFGTSIPTIFKGLSTESIQFCFWRGFVCVRGFDQKTRAPRPLMARLHFPASKLAKTKGKTYDGQE
ncbi:hypothetical protein RHSIM_Rhsim04G0135900 [Rhododendron simsii]|uniref:HhH-GPD domain-containing protein n=1 Tax=Rhododendron simsii TaxID=118357 RepID=A0A834H0H9_RHOSS|nr:hypothetical protein RHSIM_Rhsim04G0135900 [Rhododendron simsii]